MLAVYHRSVKERSLSSIEPTAKKPRRGVWIHAEAPSEDEIARLATWGFDEALLHDAADFFEVPRFERAGETAYFFARFPVTENEEVITTPVMIAVSPDAVLTVTLREPPFLSRFREGKVEFFTTQKTKFFLMLMSEINRAYTRFLTDIRRRVNRSRTHLRHIRNREMVQFVSFENTLNDFISSLMPTNAALDTILSGAHLTMYEDDLDAVEDLQLENAQLVESCKSNLKTIQNIRNAYSTIMTNNLNQTIKFLTALTIILTIPTIIASLYGMNVPLPLSEQPFAFWLIILATTLLMAVVAYIFGKKEWI